jgi:hypothetical protein
MRVHNKKAFTLVEALVTTLISTVVFAGIYSTYIVGNNAWVHYNDSVSSRREARRALSGMVNEIRAAENVRVIEGPEGSAIHFYIPMTGPVSYIWRNTGRDAGRIIRRNRFKKRIMAQNISDLSFQYLKDVVIIGVTASKRMSDGQMAKASLKERIALRSRTPFFR